MFKIADRKLEKVGFIKTAETDLGAAYERNEGSYTKEIDLIHKASGKHIVISCQKGLNTDGFNNAVGLTAYEMKWACRKMKEKGWKI